MNPLLEKYLNLDHTQYDLEELFQLNSSQGPFLPLWRQNSVPPYQVNNLYEYPFAPLTNVFNQNLEDYALIQTLSSVLKKEDQGPMTLELNIIGEIKAFIILFSHRFSSEWGGRILVGEETFDLNSLLQKSEEKNIKGWIYLPLTSYSSKIKIEFLKQRLCITFLWPITAPDLEEQKGRWQERKQKEEGYIADYLGQIGHSQSELSLRLENEIRTWVCEENRTLTWRNLGSRDNLLEAYRSHLFQKINNYQDYNIPEWVTNYRTQAPRCFNSILDVTPDLNKMGSNLTVETFYRIHHNRVFHSFSYLLQASQETVDSDEVDRLVESWKRAMIIFLKEDCYQQMNYGEVQDKEHTLVVDYIIFYRYLGYLVRFHPLLAQKLPIEIILDWNFYYLKNIWPLYPHYIRLGNNCQNWRAASAPLFLTLSFILDEWSISPLLLELAKNEINFYLSRCCLPDGTQTQYDPWYHYMFFSLTDCIELFQQRSYIGYTLRSDETNLLKNNVYVDYIFQVGLKVTKFLVSHQQNDSSYPAGARRDRRSMRSSIFFRQGICAGIADYHLFSQEARKVLEKKSNIFPYGGFFYLRTSPETVSSSDPDPESGQATQDLKKMIEGFLFCAGAPGADQGFRSRSNNNYLTLKIGGSDYLVGTERSPYEHVLSPVKVVTQGGKICDQFFHHGLKLEQDIGQRHKGYYQVATDKQTVYQWWENDSNIRLRTTYQGHYEGSYQATHVRETMISFNEKLIIISDLLTSSETNIKNYLLEWNYIPRSDFQIRHFLADGREIISGWVEHKLNWDNIVRRRLSFTNQIYTLICPTGTMIGFDYLKKLLTRQDLKMIEPSFSKTILNSIIQIGDLDLTNQVGQETDFSLQGKSWKETTFKFYSQSLKDLDLATDDAPLDLIIWRKFISLEVEAGLKRDWELVNPNTWLRDNFRYEIMIRTLQQVFLLEDKLTFSINNTSSEKKYLNIEIRILCRFQDLPILTSAFNR